MKTVDFAPAVRLNGWRKVSLGSWRPTGDSSTYSEITFDVSSLLKQIELEPILTLTTVIGRAVAKAIAENPGINSVVRFGKVYPRKTVDVFFLAPADSSGHDLSGVLIREADKKSAKDFSLEFRDQLKNLRSPGGDPFAKIKKSFAWVPGWFAKCVLDATGLLFYTFNFWSSLTLAPRDGFGSVQITNVAACGVEFALTPIAPYTRIPMVISIGVTRTMPWVVNGEVAARPVVRMGFVFDHRLWDGQHFGEFLSSLRKHLEIS